nr:reverse transcriptase domain-containing protein [Tanacetum cinerariifolium]
MHTRASNSELVEPLLEPERILNRRLRRRNRRVPFEQRNEPHAQPKVVYAPILDISYFRYFLDILENYNPMDDEPMWDADRVVALTHGSVITISETANKFDSRQRKLIRFAEKQSGRPSGSLPSNTQPNPKCSSSKPYQPPQAQNEQGNAVFTRSGKTYDPPSNPNDQQNDFDTPIIFDSEDEDEEPTPQPKHKDPKIPKPYKPKIPYPQTPQKRKNGSSIRKIPRHGSKILYSFEGTILEEKLFAEFDEFMEMTTKENSESKSDTEEPLFEKITLNTDYKIKTSLEEHPTYLELKPLPDNLEYAFLEEPSFLSVII